MHTKKKHRGLDLAVHWIASHEGVTGSKRVDQEANLATKNSSYNLGIRKGNVPKSLPSSQAV